MAQSPVITYDSITYLRSHVTPSLLVTCETPTFGGVGLTLSKTHIWARPVKTRQFHQLVKNKVCGIVLVHALTLSKYKYSMRYTVVPVFNGPFSLPDIEGVTQDISERLESFVLSRLVSMRFNTSGLSVNRACLPGTVPPRATSRRLYRRE